MLNWLRHPCASLPSSFVLLECTEFFKFWGCHRNGIICLLLSVLLLMFIHVVDEALINSFLQMYKIILINSITPNLLIILLVVISSLFPSKQWDSCISFRVHTYKATLGINLSLTCLYIIDLHITFYKLMLNRFQSSCTNWYSHLL